MVNITAKVTDAFFDRQKVIDATTRAERRVMSKQGGSIRLTARRSIRRRKKVSTPGKPPHAHTRDRVATIKNILYAYDAKNHSVIVGPVKLNGRRGKAPRLLEEGGRTTVMRRRAGRLVALPATYRKFPYMKPAFDKMRPRFAAMWANQVRR